MRHVVRSSWVLKSLIKLTEIVERIKSKLLTAALTQDHFFSDFEKLHENFDSLLMATSISSHHVKNRTAVESRVFMTQLYRIFDYVQNYRSTSKPNSCSIQRQVSSTSTPSSLTIITTAIVFNLGPNIEVLWPLLANKAAL